MINFDEIFRSVNFEEYFQLREKNPKLKPLRFKSKFGDIVYHFELAYQCLKQDADLN